MVLQMCVLQFFVFLHNVWFPLLIKFVPVLRESCCAQVLVAMCTQQSWNATTNTLTHNHGTTKYFAIV